MNGQTERIIQILEDMLRSYALDFKKAWDEQLALMELSYNNNYHLSIRVALYEVLYMEKGVELHFVGKKSTRP